MPAAFVAFLKLLCVTIVSQPSCKAGVIPATCLLWKQAMSEAPPKPVAAAGRAVVARWRILAKQRLDHLHELGSSGRWKLYHTESDFFAMLQEAHDALKVWEDLAPPDAALDKTIEVAIAQNSEDRVPGSLPKPSLLDRIQPQYDFRKS